jgi:PTH1 family peptidyl-tRNA hydrolase
MKVIVGLGNPGSKYHGTRHNVGFAVVDSLASAAGAERFAERFHAEIAEWNASGEKVLLVKPTTFMNLSGRAVRQVLDFYQVPVEGLLVVCDDVNLPLGKLRFRAKGSAGGHNGLRDIQNHLGTADYGRLRIGVDAPGHDLVDHVLSRFKPGERAVIEDAAARAAQAVEVWLREGIQVSMNRFNGDENKEEEPKRARGKRKEKDQGDATPGE